MVITNQYGAVSFLLLVIIIFCLSSCTKQQELKNKLEGTWNIQEYSGNGESQKDNNKDLQASFDTTDAGQLNFNGDATGTYQFQYKVDISGVAGGNSISTTRKVSSSGNFDWDNTENTVTITYTSGERSGEEDNFDVNESGDNRQEWSGNSEQEYPYGGGNTAVFEINNEMVLQKQ